jgi:hypothetical protein
MSAEFKSNILEATWDRSGFAAEREIKPEILIAPEQLELSRPIEASLELLRRHQIETADLDEDESIEKQVWPTSYYLIKDENQVPQLFEASLTEPSQQASLSALITTEDSDMRRLLLDQLGLQLSHNETWLQKDTTIAAASLVEHGVALIEEDEIARSLTVLVLEENGRDVSRVEIPHISFSEDEVVEPESALDGTEIQNVEQSLTPSNQESDSTERIQNQEVGESHYRIQLMRTSDGFMFFQDGIPQPGVDQADQRIQSAIQELLAQGSAFDAENLESAGIRIETTYQCIEDPNTLEIGQCIDVDINSIIIPLEKMEDEVFSDDSGEEQLNPTDTYQLDSGIKPTVATTETPSDTYSLFEDWFSAPEWIAGGKNDQTVIDANQYNIQNENYLADSDSKINFASNPSAISQIEQQELTTKSTESIQLTKHPLTLNSHHHQKHLESTKIFSIPLPTYMEYVDQVKPEILTYLSSTIPESPEVTKIFQPVVTLNRTLQLIQDNLQTSLIEQMSDKQLISASTRHSKNPKPHDPDQIKLSLPMAERKQQAIHTIVAGENVQLKESAQIQLNKTIKLENTKQVQVITGVARIAKDATAKTTSINSAINTTFSVGREFTKSNIHTQQSKIATARHQNRNLSTNIEVNQKTTMAVKSLDRQAITANRTDKVFDNKNSRSQKSRTQGKKHQAVALPTGNNESARSIVSAVVDQYGKRAELERRALQMTIDDTKDARILREQIRPLGILVDEIGRIIRQFPLASIQIGINIKSIVFTPDLPDPIDMAKLITRIAKLPVSINNHQKVVFTYQLRTVA